MPHAVEEDEDALIQQIAAGGALPGDLDNIHERELDIGEKADDAEDYEDIGSDDLGDLDEDEDEGVNTQPHANAPQQTNGQTNGHVDHAGDDGLFGDGDEDDDDPFADLFGARDDSESPQDTANDTQGATDAGQPSFDSATAEDSSFDHMQLDNEAKKDTAAQHEDEAAAEDEDPEYLEQQRLFAEARADREDRTRRGDEQSSILPPAPETDDDVFATVWPQFEANHPPRFGELLPGRRAYYLARKPLKQPKPVHPTKLTLELAPDQEKLFRIPGPSVSSLATRLLEAESKGLVVAAIEEDKDELDTDEDEYYTLEDDKDEVVGGMTWDDIVAACQDWTIPEASDSETQSHAEADLMIEDGPEEDQEGSAEVTKKKKLDFDRFLPSYSVDSFSFDDPEKATARLAKRVRLDLNDPRLLVEIQDPSTVKPQKKKTLGTFQRDSAGGLTRDFTRRYNISNDEAYDLLKENHQNKIRSNLANVALEHALPAAKLQYPFYKVKLEPREARAFHRPALALASAGIVHFDKLGFRKRKHLKGKETHEVFGTSADLSVADNSNVLLLEYSEEYPNTISNFGMANKVLNYYRRKDEQDTSRPKYDIGETSVLLPQDKSPFSIFGDVKAGETVPTLHNGMYRAPVFKHESKPTDFLLVCNRTGVEGRKWYLRNVENLHVVGQEFPSVEVPGTHSRKVTDAAKKRLRMVSYRMLRRYGKLDNMMIIDHLPGSDVAQNRSKMREFMDYDKEKGWLPRRGETVPEEPAIRSWIKPEDLCLLESMQVGDRQLQDAGYTKDEGDEIEDDDEKTTQSLDQQLAPWQTSKNFLMACQGKAFVAVHGEGDPTGRGEGYNLVRTSMKGGYREVGESIEDKLDAKRIKELGGHQYNVARQHKAYTEALLRIWDAQKRSLTSTEELDDTDMAGIEDAETTRARSPSIAVNSRSFRGDDATTNVTSHTNASQAERVLRITRRRKERNGRIYEEQEIISDPTVIREYKKRRNEIYVEKLSIEQLKPTGNPDLDELIKKRLQNERDRIKRNQERRYARNKAKGLPLDAGSPGDAMSPDVDMDDDDGDTRAKGKKNNTGGTQRKCANCGQVGHIKTNKKLCPMLNGTIQSGEGFGDSAFGSQPTPTPNAPTAPSPAVGFG